VASVRARQYKLFTAEARGDAEEERRQHAIDLTAASNHTAREAEIPFASSALSVLALSFFFLCVSPVNKRIPEPLTRAMQLSYPSLEPLQVT
jgi:hypothetical protein